MNQYNASFRDKIGVPIINVLMHVFTSQSYRDFIRGAIAYGMNSAARDIAENKEAPKHWRDYA